MNHLNGSEHYVPPALEQRVSLTFTGTVEETAKALATQVGYRFSTAGRKSATPIMVTVNADDKPVVEIFRDIGIQSNGRATVEVNADRKLVEVRYGA